MSIRGSSPSVSTARPRVTCPAFYATAREATDRPLVAYPNGGDRWDAAARRWVSDAAGGAFDPIEVAGWTDLGAAWLGGCCGTRPDDIAALAAALATRTGAARPPG